MKLTSRTKIRAEAGERMEVYPGAGYSEDPQVHSTPDLPTEDGDKTPVIPGPQKVEVGKESKAVFTDPIRYVIDPFDAMDKIEDLAENLAKTRPDMAQEIAVIKNTVEQMESKALGQGGTEQAEETFAVGEGIQVHTQDGVFTGAITKDNGDGTYDISTDQAMSLERVPAASISKVETQPTPQAAAAPEGVNQMSKAALKAEIQKQWFVAEVKYSDGNDASFEGDTIIEADNAEEAFGKLTEMMDVRAGGRKPDSVDGEDQTLVYEWFHGEGEETDDGWTESIEGHLRGPFATRDEAAKNTMSSHGRVRDFEEGDKKPEVGASKIRAKLFAGKNMAAAPAKVIAKRKAEKLKKKVAKKAKKDRYAKKIKAAQVREGFQPMEIFVVEENAKPVKFDDAKHDVEPAQVYKDAAGHLALVNPDGQVNYEDQANDEVELDYWKQVHGLAGVTQVPEVAEGQKGIKPEAKPAAEKEAVAASAKANLRFRIQAKKRIGASVNVMPCETKEAAEAALKGEGKDWDAVNTSNGETTFLKEGKEVAIWNERNKQLARHIEAAVKASEDEQGPDEEDIIIGKDELSAFYNGKEIVSVSQEEADEDSDALYKAIAAWCDAKKYWPGVWWISDHGNPNNVTADVYKFGKQGIEGKGVCKPAVKAAGDEGWVDQDGKPIDPKDIPAARKMARERREAMEALDKELAETGKLTNHPAVEASAFDKIEEIEIGGGYIAKRKGGKKEGEEGEAEGKEIEVLDADGKVIETYPDAFGDDTVMIIKFLRKALDIKKADDKKAGAKEEKEEKPGAKKDEGESAADKNLELPDVKKEKEKKEKEDLEAAAKWMEDRTNGMREIAAKLLKLGRIEASQEDIDAGLLGGLTLKASQEKAAQRAISKQVMNLLATPEDEFLLLKASLPLMRPREQKIMASQTSLPPMNLSAASVILPELNQGGMNLGLALLRGGK
jgi:hypothetical protein